MDGSVTSLQKKRRGSRNQTQTLPRPSQTVGNPSYIFFLSHLCCRGPYNSIGARRYTLFVTGHSKFQDPPQIRSHLSHLAGSCQISQTSKIAKLRIGRSPGSDAVQTSNLDKSCVFYVGLDFWCRSGHHSKISYHHTGRKVGKIAKIHGPSRLPS